MRLGNSVAACPHSDNIYQERTLGLAFCVNQPMQDCMTDASDTGNTTDTGKVSRRTRILNAAEKLFSQKGYDAVSLREIAREADVDLALPNYYFGRKPKVFEAAFLRRAQLLNEWRLDALDKAIAASAPNPPSVHAIMDAYLRPILTGRHIKDSGWKHYYALVAYVNNSTEWGGKLMSEFFDPMVERFLSALRTSMPNASDKDIFWSYQCLSGSLTLAFAQTGRLDRLSHGKLRSTDLESGCDTMIDFCTAGFLAACEKADT